MSEILRKTVNFIGRTYFSYESVLGWLILTIMFHMEQCDLLMGIFGSLVFIPFFRYFEHARHTWACIARALAYFMFTWWFTQLMLVFKPGRKPSKIKADYLCR